MTAIATTSPSTSSVQSLAMMMRALKLPAFARYAEEVAQKAEREGWTFGQYLHHLAELETHERRRRRTERHLKDSHLLPEKTLATLTRSRLTPKIAKMLPTLCEGGFVERGDNLLAFGLPGRGKTHLVAPSATSSFSVAFACSSPPRSRSFSACSPPSETSVSRRSSRRSMRTTR